MSQPAFSLLLCYKRIAHALPAIWTTKRSLHNSRVAWIKSDSIREEIQMASRESSLDLMTRFPKLRWFIALEDYTPCVSYFAFLCCSHTTQNYLEEASYADNPHHFLEKSWSHDPIRTLKTICFSKGFCHTRKNTREYFYASALWLHEYHPRTLACNVEVFARFGCLKDLLEILYRVFNGTQFRAVQIDERRMFSGKQNRRLMENSRRSVPNNDNVGKYIAMNQIDNVKEKENVRDLRKGKRILMAQKAIEKYKSDPKYRFLHDQIADVFAKLLKADLEFLNEGEIRNISLASKWCPSLDSSYDRSLLFCESVARRLFPYDSSPEYEGTEESHYAHRVRDRLRKEVLVPLRRALDLPEVYMSSNKWNLLPYNKVASTAMKTHKKLFLKHDSDRFLQNIQIGKHSKKLKVCEGLLLPHEILSLLHSGDVVGAEQHWRQIVDAFTERGTFKDCLAVCNVSDLYRSKVPNEFSMGMTLLTSYLSDSPWNGKTIVYSLDQGQSQVVNIKGSDLKSKIEFLKGANVSGNPFVVLEKILGTAVECKLTKDKMIKRIIHFNDLVNYGESHELFDMQKKNFEASGYEMPSLVLWNLKKPAILPCVKDYGTGVVTVQGFSNGIFRAFLENDGVLTAQALMEKKISGENYDKLVVLD